MLWDFFTKNRESCGFLKEKAGFLILMKEYNNKLNSLAHRSNDFEMNLIMQLADRKIKLFFEPFYQGMKEGKRHD